MQKHMKKDVKKAFEAPPAPPAALVAVLIWSAVWKGLSLWRAAKDDSPGWFVALFALNTAGLLDMIYLFAVSRRKRENA